MRDSCANNYPSNHKRKASFAMATKIITRQEAISQGFKYYFTGVPCKRNHVCNRLTGNSGCLECDRLIRRKLEKDFYYRHRERLLKKKKPYQDEYREKNRKRINEQKIRHYEANKERIRQQQKDYYKNNKDDYVIYSENRRARKRNAAGSYTCDQALGLLEAQNYKCVNCKCCLKTNKKHLDHITPLALGGSNDIKNLQWLCARCNLSKKDKHPIDWAQKNGRLL